ncbi:beta-lactamase-like protein [Aspergillus taichungensis]|uniref:Beta-lactamase-like protein n=1 Tax=Aspergillus taichungensis TaxID=482145 RepID=A0A2J5HH20_9EURO|nr:beta-lactamase-like protein [Aspergillus taichungensis]
MQPILLDPQNVRHPTRDAPPGAIAPDLPSPQGVVTHPSKPGGENASLFFVGTATTIIEWAGIRIMTDPNFLHAGDHVHLGPGVSSMRRTNPALGLHELPRIDLVLLSHYHGDHFDQVVEASLRRDLPIITTPHAKSHLTRKGADSFTDVSALDPFESQMIHIKNTLGPRPSRLRVTGMPGKHVPESSVVEYLNATAHAIPPTNGWMLELGTEGSNEDETGFVCGYRIYITGDTLLVDDLKHIAQRYAGERINLMLAHLGGTTIPSPSLAPLALLVTMDAEQGVRLIQLIQPDLTIPIHYDDYDVFASSLAEFKTEVERAGLENKVVYLDRKDRFDFAVRVHPNKEKVY